MTGTPQKLLLTDAVVKREPFALGKPKILRDAKIAGFHVWIGKTQKNFRYQYGTPRINGQRGRTQIEWLGEHPHVSADESRTRALDLQLRRSRGEPVRLEPEPEAAPALTLKAAWQLYRAGLVKEAKSPRTIADYDNKVGRHLALWHDVPLALITREQVTRQHAVITEAAKRSRQGNKLASGKYAANGTLRVARAIWNFAKDELETPGLPDRNPFRSGKLFHKERARDTGMGADQLAAWWAQLQALENPIRREMHLFTLMSGLRRTDVVSASWANIDRRKHALRIPSPKGGEDRAFELPLSTAIRQCLQRAKEAGETFYPDASKTWIFPSASGHVAETKEPKRKLSHTGHALRHSFRTLAAAAGVDRLRVKILMNHAIDGDVTDSYTNVPALFASLLDAQEQISNFILRNLEL